MKLLFLSQPKSNLLRNPVNSTFTIHPRSDLFSTRPPLSTLGEAHTVSHLDYCISILIGLPGLAISEEKSRGDEVRMRVYVIRLPALSSLTSSPTTSLLTHFTPPTLPFAAPQTCSCLKASASRLVHLLFLPPRMLLPRHPQSLLPHLLQVFTQMSPSQ